MIRDHQIGHNLRGQSRSETVLTNMLWMYFLRKLEASKVLVTGTILGESSKNTYTVT